jgi:hypothetical protein
VNARWTGAQDTALIAAWARGVPASLIAAMQNRSPKAIYARVNTLRRQGLIADPDGAYLPDAGLDVPCSVCGTRFTRARVMERYCGPPCAQAARRVTQPKVRRDGICPRCGTNPRPARPDGGRRPWCRSCESAQKAEYQRTPAGKATAARYWHSEKGRAAGRRAFARFYAKQKAAQT